MTALFRLSMAGGLALFVAACATVGSNTGDADTTASGAYRALGTKGVPPEQADWLSRSHARPADR